MASFKLKLKALPFDTQVFNYHLDGDFFNQIEETEVRSSSVDITLQVTRKTDNTYAMLMECRGSLVIPCDRCLEDMTWDVDTSYAITVRQEGDELDDSLDDVLIVPQAWSELDVTDLLRDTVLLTIPIVHMHDDGECNPEMLARLNNHMSDSLPDDNSDAPLGENETTSDNIDPRWEALRKLKDNN